MTLVSLTHSTEEVACMMVDAAVAKHRQRPLAIFLKAVTAGIYLSFGGLLSIVLAGGSPTLRSENPGLVKIVAGFVFPTGLVMIVLQGQELVTANMMIFPMSALKGRIPLWAIAVNWFVVFFGNLAGSLFFGLVLVKYSHVVSSEPYLSYIRDFAVKKAADPSWLEIYLRGIACNWLVCVAVWQAAAAKDVLSKIVASWFPVWLFVACSFDHVVANMFTIPLGISMGADITVSEYIKKSLFACLFGNVTAGLVVALTATYFWLDNYVPGGEVAKMEAGMSRLSGSTTQGEDEPKPA